jgi:uncharacterized protein (TIGR02246 family)
MKVCLAALLAFAIGVALPTFAQQTNTPDPKLRQRLIAVIQKHNDAINSNDAAALAALYTEDAVIVEQEGPTFGRKAIEKHWADRFQKVHFSDLVDTVDEDSPHVISTDGKEIWATGGWSATIKGENFGPTPIKGFWSVIRKGDDWKIQMLTTNVTPAPAAPTGTTQENATVTPETRQELEAVDTKLDQAIDKNDAVAAAALFTEDAILMLPLEFAAERSGIFSDRPAIEQWYTQKFTEYHVTDSHGKLEQIHAIDNGMWAVGTWMHTVNFRHTPAYRAIFFVPVAHSYQIRKMFIEF